MRPSPPQHLPENHLQPSSASGFSRRPVEFVHVDLAEAENRTPEFLALNPNGKVPVLDTSAGSLSEANAIMCYLARLAGSDLWPSDDRQIEVLRWLSWNSNHFTRHAGTLHFEHIVKPAFGMGDPNPAVVEEVTGFFKRFAAVLNDHLKGRVYLVGDALTGADLAVGITLPYAEDARIPLAEFPEIERWHGRLSELPAWLEPFPVARAAA
jgi:glutathione S-transferase